MATDDISFSEKLARDKGILLFLDQTQLMDLATTFKKKKESGAGMGETGGIGAAEGCGIIICGL